MFAYEKINKDYSGGEGNRPEVKIMIKKTF
jgi:hypothetical protein